MSITLQFLNYLYIYYTHITMDTTNIIHYFLYQICVVWIRFIFFCNCRIPYNNASAVGGQPVIFF